MNITSFTKVKSKWMPKLNEKYKTIKFLKEIIGDNHYDL